VEGAQHLACTIEMVNMGKRCDVAVIDEIQMIGDESRGWAWTRALQGVPANEIHLCGDASALPLVRRVGASCACCLPPCRAAEPHSLEGQPVLVQRTCCLASVHFIYGHGRGCWPWAER